MTMSLFDKRQQRLREGMKKEDLDALIIHADIYRPGNTAYFTGLHQCGAGTSQAWSALLLTQELSILFVGFEMVEEGKQLIQSNTDVKRSDTMAEFLKTITAKRVGAVGLNLMSVSISEMMLQALSIDSWIGADHLMNEMRWIKSDEEIETMKTAFQASDKGFEAGMAAIKTGATEKDLAEACATAIIKEGARTGFWPMVMAGKNTGNAMQSPSDFVIKEDMPVVMDIGAYINGFFSDNTRAALYKVSTKQYRDVIETCEAAMKEGFKAAKPGKPFSDVEWAVRGVIEENGFIDYILHNVGHGIAYDAEEPMPIGPDSDLIMEVGMTFTIEPGIYIPHECGCRLEEAVYMTEDGAVPFSEFPLVTRFD